MFVDDFGNEIRSMVLGFGIYNVTLKKPVEVCNSGFKVIRFPFTVDGLDCETIPNCFHLDKTNIDNSPEEKALCYTREVKIRRCFRLTSPFKDEYFHECIGKKGKIFIKNDCTGNKIIDIFFLNNHITKEELDIIDCKWKPY